ncbi:MAG TPA: alpha/beta hydrolase [Aliicoccus persicus]|uniref:Alpha/beta hydrolase n=1 Tax=Aliicoccus persicus TaxID=930138 RepID=A0A921DZ80_9STAP|nr:alpha/beta hydrolase [Aliicoccus persicus]
MDEVEQAREAFKLSRKSFKELSVDNVATVDRLISIDNLTVPLRIYTPKGHGPFPILIYFHDGGFVLGDLDSSDNLCRYLSKNSSRIVVSVDYRLAPENPYPAALEDALGAVRWVNDFASELNGNNKNLALVGSSAGGNLAAQATIYFRNSEEVCIDSQWLFYPWLNFETSSDSHRSHGKGYNLTTEELKWFTKNYLPSNIDLNSPEISPLHHKKLNDLPYTIILVAQLDPLKDDGTMYAKALVDAGNEVDYKCCKNLPHSFLSMAGEIHEAREVLDDLVYKLKKRN